MAKNTAMCYSKSQLYLQWSCKLIFARFCRYFVEFSKPDKLRPIPEGTVKVYFDITVGDGPDEYEIEFNFENESLKHRLDSTMREAKFQVSNKMVLAEVILLNTLRYCRVGSIAFLRTSTRSSNCCIWELSLNIRAMSTRRVSLSTHSCPSSIS